MQVEESILINKIPDGYKQTEVGVIPGDWEIKRLHEISRFENGKAHEQSIDERGDFVVINSKFISSEGEVRKYSKQNILPLSLGDITLVMSDVPNGKALAKCFHVDSNNTYTLNQRIGKIRAINEVDNRFLFYKLNRNKYYLAFDSGSGQTNLKRQEVLDCPIPLPPTLTEQTAIANALSDMDALIEAQEALLAKKRAIKQGAMQELLRPKEGWEEIDFKDVAWFQEGPGLRNWQFTKSGIKVINITNLENGYLNLNKTDRHISLAEFQKMYQHFEIDANDIVVASSGNSYGKVAIVRTQDLPLLMNTSVIRFKPLPDLNYYFLLAFLKSNFFIDQIDLLITGGAQPNFGPVHLKKLKIHLPSSLKEQKSIGLMLADMDSEIEQLEAQLAKYQQLKRGMMQELLTGRKRLI